MSVVPIIRYSLCLLALLKENIRLHCTHECATMQIMRSEPNYVISHLRIIPEAMKRVRLSGANQNSQLGTYKNTNFNNSQNH